MAKLTTGIIAGVLALLAGFGVIKGGNALNGTAANEKLPEEIIEVEGKKYELCFLDDFDGKTLNKKKWHLCPEWKRGDIGGRWDDSCVSLDGEGNLVITAKLDEDGTPLSGGVRSKGLYEQCKGYFETRCRLQSAKGLWTAFWLMCDGEHNVGNGAVDGAEIDIYESFSIAKGSINHAIHYDGYDKDHKCWSKAENLPEVYDGEFHTFSLLWTDTAYIFYVDGKEVKRLCEGDAEYPGCCGVPTYLKLTTEFGTWGGKVDASELPDASLTVDYVKCYREVTED